MARTLIVQSVRIDIVDRRVWENNVELRLSRKEFDLLRVLMEHAGEVVSRSQLMSLVWHQQPSTIAVSPNATKTIDVHLGWLRRKIGDNPRKPHLITTVRNRGLRFELNPPTGPAPDGEAPAATNGRCEGSVR